jgi:hypothetical protein
VRGLFVVRQDGETKSGGEEESIREECDSDAGAREERWSIATSIPAKRSGGAVINSAMLG